MTAIHQKTLPNLIVIGTQKGGTTSMHYYLNQHPQIAMSRVKELNFFIQERAWEKGLEWYMSHFSSVADIHGESSPNYTAYPIFKRVPERIASVVPDAKLIYILRDPVERMISEYLHFYAEGWEDRSLEDVFAHVDNTHYHYRSQYYMQLEQYLSYFPRTQILILTQENLARQRLQALQGVFRFLGVDDSFDHSIFRISMHRTRFKRRKTPFGIRLRKNLFLQRWLQALPYRIRGPFSFVLYFPFSRKISTPVLNKELRQTVADFLQDDIHHLRENTGLTFERWSV